MAPKRYRPGPDRLDQKSDLAGWWGFAALNTSDEKKKHQGEDKDIELGAVLWVEFHDMK